MQCPLWGPPRRPLGALRAVPRHPDATHGHARRMTGAGRPPHPDQCANQPSASSAPRVPPRGCGAALAGVSAPRADARRRGPRGDQGADRSVHPVSGRSLRDTCLRRMPRVQVSRLGQRTRHPTQPPCKGLSLLPVTPVIGTRYERGDSTGTLCTETQSTNQCRVGGRPGSFWTVCRQHDFVTATGGPLIGTILVANWASQSQGRNGVRQTIPLDLMRM